MRVTINRHANDPRSAFSQADKHDAEMRAQSEANHRARNEAAAADARAATEVTRKALMRRKGLPDD
jgi:1,2-phenylacetyl-CoA epoxidase PaaB subunit